MSDPLANVNGFFEAVNTKGPIIAGRVGVAAIGILTIILGFVFILSGSDTVQGVAKTAVGVVTKKGLVKK